MEVYLGIWRYISDGHNMVTILFDTSTLNLYPYIARAKRDDDKRMPEMSYREHFRFSVL
ncbi:unnamed protein product [marine sediment metagenome]|uniref:Uncharacterized protein n=1 Tax=marine sediment metagenome TaxID=412755 RepID=X0VAQ0_9ZZZZ